MNKNTIPEIAPGIFAIGSIDRDKRIFDALAPIPIGTTYNSYLVQGTGKTAVVDTIHPDFTEQWLAKIEQIKGDLNLDYVIMNHAEPDHAGSIPLILEKCNARLLTTKRGAEMAQVYFHVDESRIDIVNDGDKIELGGKTLQFIPAPFIHWPETMMTWLSEHNILFSCDFFSSHNTTGLYDDEAADVMSWAKKYYGEIMMPMAKMGRMALDKIKDLDIKMIAPSHGPIYRNPEPIIDAYRKWTSQETLPKVAVIYVSMYHNTERMAMQMVQQLETRGIEVATFNMVDTEPGELAGPLVDTRAVILASPTVIGSMHPLIQYATIMIKTLKAPLKYGLFVNSYGWGKVASKEGVEFFDKQKIELVGVVEVNGAPTDEDFANLREAADALADRILAE